MTLHTQYAIDTWRLRQHGEAPPPAPGTHEAKLLHAWWTARKEARRAWGPPRGRRRSGLRLLGALRHRAGRA